MQVDTEAALRNPDRLAALRRFGLLDTPREESFDRLTRLVTRLLEVPAALIGLIEEQRQFFKSCVGLPEPWAARREYPVRESICQYVLATRQPLAIEDTRQHPLVRERQVIADLGVVSYAGIPLMTSDGHALGTFCVCAPTARGWSTDQLQLLQDLAASTMAEIELRAAVQEAQQQHHEKSVILERIADGFFALDTGWRFTYLNRHAEELFGRPRAELLNKNIWEELPIFVGSEFYAQYQQAMAEQVTVEFEAFCPPNGRWFAVHAYPSAQGLSIYYQDVTERKSSASLLTGQLQLLEMIASDSQLPEILEALARLVEAHSEQTSCSILLLEGAQLQPGAAPGLPEAYGRAMAGLVIGEGAASCGTAAYRKQRVVVTDIASDPLWEGYRELALAHNLRACWSTPILSGSSKLLGTLAIYAPEARAPGAKEQQLMDMATSLAGLAIERKRVEGERLLLLRCEREARQQAEQALRLRDEFLSVAAHEMKSPVTSFVGYIQLLERRARREGLVTLRDERALAALSSQARRLQRLTTSLLDLSRLQIGQLAIAREIVDVAALVQRVVAELQSTQERYSIELSAPPSGLLVRGDDLRLEQVIYNLLQNAIKYSPDGGTIRVQLAVQGQGLSILIQDQGIGIPAADLPKLFARFFRASNVNTQQLSGMGLGLYVVKEIVALHGGTIDVRSSEGQGSTFSVWLPLVDDETAQRWASSGQLSVDTI